MAQKYHAPPIVNATVELKFTRPVSDAGVATLASRLQKILPNRQNLREREVQLKTQTHAVEVVKDYPVSRLISDDATEQSSIKYDALVFEQLAPYPGWESFSRLFYDILEAASTTIRTHGLARIGMRFINRFDFDENEVLQFPNPISPIVLKVGYFSQKINYISLNLQSETSDGRFKILFNTTSIDSPFVGCQAYTVDIDVIIEDNVPSSIPEIVEILEEMRMVKNACFESVITDLARERFHV